MDTNNAKDRNPLSEFMLGMVLGCAAILVVRMFGLF
jgi:hypothetical protein